MSEQLIDGARLEGVSATTLWTLRNRAVEAMRPDSVIDDPWAVELYQRISYDYDKFGKPSQVHPLRALAFDQAIAEYATAHPAATVVALGEGLQTSYWRLANKELTWLTVDLPPVIEVRDRLLPAEPAVTSLAVSALDRSWMDRIDPDRGVVVSAEGLLMYLTEAQAFALIADCAERFPGGWFVFDSIPAWFRDKTIKGLKLTDSYVAPPMPFSLSVSQALALPGRIDRVSAASAINLPPGRGIWGNPLARALSRAPLVRDLRPAITRLTFA